jgi:hypothetical protein
MALASVLMVLAVAVLAALTMACRCLFAWGAGAQMQDGYTCACMAQSIVEEAIAKFFGDTTFGTHNEILHNSYPGGGVAELTFSKTAPADMADAWSLNNVQNPQSLVASQQQVVPGYCIYLVGHATYRNCSRTVQCLLQGANATMAVGSSGAVTSSGGLFVARLPPGMTLAQNPNPSQLLPATLASNSAQNPAIQLGPGTLISGNCQAVGSILLSPGGVQILGATEPGNTPVGLPSIDVASLDPGVGGTTIPINSPSIPGGTLAGMWRAAGNLDVLQDLTMQNAVLYVNGAANFYGNVSGTGAIIVNGNAQLAGGASLTATQEMAVVAAGDLTVLGKGKTVSAFQGLMYTGGNFTAKSIAMTGTFVANSPSGSRTEIDDASVALQPSLNSVSFVVSPPNPGAGSPSPGGSGSPAPSGGNGYLDTICGNNQNAAPVPLVLENGDTFTGTLQIYTGNHYKVSGSPATIRDASGNVIWSGQDQHDPNGGGNSANNDVDGNGATVAYTANPIPPHDLYFVLKDAPQLANWQSNAPPNNAHFTSAPSGVLTWTPGAPLPRPPLR